jgi:hypothetical protein
MNIPDSLKPHLSGDAFSSGLTIRYDWTADDYVYESRFQLLSRLVGGKKVIHVGCVDHDPALVEHKIARGKWLHKVLCEAAARCTGVDINADGIRYLKEKLGYDDVMVADVTSTDVGPLRAESWDYLLLPEVLEHIGNPVDFLRGIRGNLQANVEWLLITVPNAFMHENVRLARHGQEAINTDHRFWFTPFTLAKLVEDAGYEIDRLWFCKAGPVRKRSFLRNWFYARHPMLRSNIVLRARFTPRQPSPAE